MPRLHCATENDIRFIQPQTGFSLPDHTVHIWKFPLAPINERLLSETEIARAERFRSPGDRNRFSSGRGMLKRLCSEYLGMPVEGVVITGERHEKPGIRQNTRRSFHFNLSHSGSWILIAFADSELGIDIEEMKPEFPFQDIVADQFSDAEKIFIRDAGEPGRSFYELWTRKEAVLKAWGSGMPADLRTIPSLDGMHTLPSGHQSWELKSFPVGKEYQAALAYSDQVRTLSYFDGIGLMI